MFTTTLTSSCSSSRCPGTQSDGWAKKPSNLQSLNLCVSKREPKPTNHFSNSSAAFASNRPSVYAALNLYGDPKRHRNIENRHFVLSGRSRRGKEQSNRSGSTPPPTVGGGQKKDRQHWKNPWYSFPNLSQERTCIAALLVQLVGGLRGEDRRLFQPDGRQCAANCDRVLQVPWWGRIRVWQVPETWPKDRWCREHVESTGGR